MKRLNRFCWFAIFMSILFFIFILFSSCGSKKKITQKSQFSTEIAKVERVSQLEQKNIEIKNDINTGIEKLTEKEAENFQAEIDDPTKKASITKKEKDGETIWELDNIKNFNAGKEKSKEQSKDTIAQKKSEIDNSFKIKDSLLQLNVDASGSNRDVAVEKSGGIPWWVWVLAIIIILLIITRIIKKAYFPI